jgi:hypothetical protein
VLAVGLDPERSVERGMAVTEPHELEQPFHHRASQGRAHLCSRVVVAVDRSTVAGRPTARARPSNTRQRPDCGSPITLRAATHHALVTPRNVRQPLS